MALRYFDWDGSPTVVDGDARASLDLDGVWKLGSSKAVLRAEWREAPEMSRAELAARAPGG